MVLAHLAFSLALLAPQDDQAPDPRITSALTKSEQDKLNGLAKKWYEAMKKWEDEESSAKRMRLAKNVDKTRAKFMKDWSAKEKKEPLKHVGDLLAIFDNVFPYKKETGTGEMKSVRPKDGGVFDVVVPRSYKYNQKVTTVVMLPAHDGSAWASSKDHHAASWKGVEAASDWLFVMPRMSEGDDCDLIHDLSTQTGDSNEKTHIRDLLLPVGQAQKMFRFDRNHLLLDCAKGSCGFALRLATYFPTRFSGLILRHPVDVGVTREGRDELRAEYMLDSLAGMPVALVQSEATSAACEKLKKKLDSLHEGACTVFDAADPELNAKLGDWASKAKRDLFREKVVLAPNHDSFRKAYWVSIDRAESAHAGAEGRPYLKAEADRAANRITIEARNIASFQLLLNDALVDLDKEFTVVVNGKAVAEKKQRSLQTLTEFVSFGLFDPSRVWTATYARAVPRPESSSGAGPGGK